MTLVSPVPTFSSPIDSGDRIRSLFAKVIETSPSLNRNPVQRSRSLSIADSINNSSDISIPVKEFETSWPSSLKDTEAAEKAILPFLLGQAASRSGSLLLEIITSLLTSDSSTTPSTSNINNNESTISLLSEPCTLSSLQTPLHIAVLSSQLSNVELLLSHGASIHTRDIFSHTALFYAAKLGININRNGKEIVLALKSTGAHLGESEIENGEVGLEILKVLKGGNEKNIEIWKLSCGDDWDRAIECLKLIVG